MKKLSKKIIDNISHDILLGIVPKYAAYILVSALNGKGFYFYKGLRNYHGHYKLNQATWEQWSYYTLGQSGVSVTVKNDTLTDERGIYFRVDHPDKQAAAELQSYLVYDIAISEMK
jgi:hypothetical protein